MFKKKEYEGETFKGMERRGERLRGVTFRECRFEKCDLAESSFDQCEFIDSRFQECDLSLARVDGSVFRGVEFRDSKLVGVDWTQAAWGKRGLLSAHGALTFVKCVLNYASFFGLEMEELRMEKCTAAEVDFSEASLKKAVFAGTDLEKSIFRHTNLEGADFAGAKNYAIPAETNRLKGARFSLPEAMALLYSMDIVIEDFEEGGG